MDARGYFTLGLLNVWLKTHLQTRNGLVPVQNTTFWFFFVFFSFIDRTVYHTAREGKAQSEVVLEIKTNINLSVGSAYKPEDNAI